jgi:endonuclease/exonuclease/phosphatase family metal-dependent hydrolase
MDGVTSASRIARVIGQAAPDIVALQELDVGRARSNHADQAHQLALALAMSREFHAALAVREELYGDAVLTALPMRLVRSGWLPGSPRREPRGALWVSVDVDGVAWQIINTHLGLRVGERAAQIDHLLGDGWLEAALRAGPVVFLGDLNAGEGSYVCRRLADRLTDVQRAIPGWRPRATWFGQRPTLRLDHIYVSSDIAVDAVTVVDSALARRASDHLPIVASLRLREARPTDLTDCNVYSADGPTITRSDALTAKALDSRPDRLRP